jgi:hypothetical protein
VPRSGLTPVVLTIADGQSLSPASGILPAGDLVAVITDSGWNAAGITFQGSYDGVAANFFNLWNAAGEVAVASITAAAMVAVDPLLFRGCQFLKVRSGTAGSAVNQTGATVVTLLFRTVK